MMRSFKEEGYIQILLLTCFKKRNSGRSGFWQKNLKMQGGDRGGAENFAKLCPIFYLQPSQSTPTNNLFSLDL